MRDPLEQLLQQAFALFDARRFAQADGVYRKVLDRDPTNHEAVHMSAVIAHATGQTDRAAKLFARAIELAPDLPHYHQNAGKFYAEQDKHDTAIPLFKRAIELNPNEPQTHANLSNSLRYTGRLDEAEAAARAGLAVVPDHPQCLAQLGTALRDQGRVHEAIDALKKSVAIRPAPDVYDTLAFQLYTDERLTRETFLEYHRAFGRVYADPIERALSKPHTGVDRSPDRKLRVGYVSADFRRHPVMAFMDGPLRSHDPRHFDVTCYSTTLQHDDVTKRIQKYPLRFVDCRFDTLEQLIARIRKDRIDLLVDLSGHTANNRLLVFAAKPAPVQISYLGDPGTTGMRQFDYRITEPLVDPPDAGESWYTERLLRLPGGFSCYTPDPVQHPDVSELPALTGGHLTFVSLHTIGKINSQVLDLWSRVLRAIPASRLVMMRHNLVGSTADRLRAAFADRGVDPARLDLRHQPLGGPLHFFTYRHADLALDCFPFSGHTTACEAMYNGVPTLTLPGPRPPSRFVTSVLTQAGLQDFIARDEDHFVSLATDLSHDLPRLAALRAGLRQQVLSSRLCDAPAFTRELESAYRTAWHAYCATDPK